MTPYEEWKKSHKLDLQVYTDEQMFNIGYHTRDEEVGQLRESIEKLEKDYRKMYTKLKKANL